MIDIAHNTIELKLQIHQYSNSIREQYCHILRLTKLSEKINYFSAQMEGFYFYNGKAKWRRSRRSRDDSPFHFSYALQIRLDHSVAFSYRLMHAYRILLFCFPNRIEINFRKLNLVRHGLKMVLLLLLFIYLRPVLYMPNI